MKYILTYVGLSDSDYRANGYSEPFLFDTLEEAKSYMETLADNEKANCEDEEREYEILEDSEREFRMSWSSQGEQVRMQIHTVQEETNKLSSEMHLFCETVAMLSADLYEFVYEHSDDFCEACRTIIDLAQEFERGLDWRNECEEKDYIEELEKFERMFLDSFKNDLS